MSESPYRTNEFQASRPLINWDNWRLRYMRFFTKRREVPGALKSGLTFAWQSMVGGILFVLATVVAYKLGVYLNEVIFNYVPYTAAQRERGADNSSFNSISWLLGFAAVTSPVWLRLVYRYARYLLSLFN